ncbi:MAG: single-stranded-DNA-specific exonuclease RecJ, partial [Lachnospiraceae bacterium]|nr:single-stranded-DNA-specific exonuclease RecJ [Lachnospiraceae bacterium]
RRQLNENCGLTEEDFVEKVHIDVPMPLAYADKKLAEELQILEPFGTANPKPLFACKEVHFLSGRKLGAKENFARYGVEQEGKRYEVVYFGGLEKFHAFLKEKFGEGADEALYRGGCDYCLSITYQLGINSYRGRSEVQILMQHFC